MHLNAGAVIGQGSGCEVCFAAAAGRCRCMRGEAWAEAGSWGRGRQVVMVSMAGSGLRADTCGKAALGKQLALRTDSIGSMGKARCHRGMVLEAREARVSRQWLSEPHLHAQTERLHYRVHYGHLSWRWAVLHELQELVILALVEGLGLGDRHL